MTPDSRRTPRAAVPAAWIFFALAVAVCGLAITSRSFWIDEIESARIAQQPTLAAAWEQVFRIHGSETQMPFYVVWVWACGQLAGTGELAMRAVNALWFIPGVMAFALALPRVASRWTFFLVAAGSPFLWYYLNEARAYSMQAGLSLFLFAMLARWRENPETPVRSERWRVTGFALALALLGCGSMLGMIFAATPLLAAAVLLPQSRLRELIRAFRPAWLAVAGIFFLTGIYYLWALHTGARASAVAGTDWRNVLFIGYELFGFDGLGPGRSEIREGGLRAFQPFAVALILYGGTVLILTALAAREIWRRLGGKKCFLLALAVALPAAVILTAGAVLHFRVLGRHCAPLIPVALWILAAGVLVAWRRGTAGKFLVGVFFIFYFASSLSLRLAARHEKDDYRAAAALATTAAAAGKIVWWNALKDGAVYYHVPAAGPARNAPGVFMLPYPGLQPLPVPPPDLVIATRADIFDVEGALAAHLAREHYRPTNRFAGFTIWERNPACGP